MVNMTRVAKVATLAGLALATWALAGPSPARAITTSDQAAAILFWPKIIVNTSAGTDTLIRLTNINTAAPKQAHCHLIDANSHCSNNPAQVCSGVAGECGMGACTPGWSETDFDIVLTVHQPLVWKASTGVQHGGFPIETGVCLVPPSPTPVGFGCTSTNDCLLFNINAVCNLSGSNLGSGIPPVPEDPFVGSMQCIQFDPLENPPGPDQGANVNSLIGEASVESVIPGGTLGAPPEIDVATYNAVGVKSLSAGSSSNVLNLDGVEYAACPTTLILDHLFDDAENTTDLTLVPCGNNFLTQTGGSATAQFVVFNEFEQRFSTTKAVDCFLEKNLSTLDTVNPARSIFSEGVSGTELGQTRIRSVGSAPTGRGVVGVAIMHSLGSTAYNLHQFGDPSSGFDVITLP